MSLFTLAGYINTDGSMLDFSGGYERKHKHIALHTELRISLVLFPSLAYKPINIAKILNERGEVKANV